VPAAARVHRCDELDPRGEADMRIGPRDIDFARLQRLPQAVENRALEFGQFVEKQHAQMREADLSGPHFEPAAGQRRHARRMVRRTERPRAADAPAFEQAGDRLDHAHLQRLRRGKRREDARQARGEQALARTRRAAHQQVRYGYTVKRDCCGKCLGMAGGGPIADCPLLAAAPQKLAARALGSRQSPHDPVVDR